MTASTLLMLVWVVKVFDCYTRQFKLCDFSFSPFLQPHVSMVNCDWQVVTLQMKAEWRSVLTMYGVLCVLIPGETLMLLWYVGSWDTLHKVSIRSLFMDMHLFSTIHPIYQQMRLPLTMLTLVLVLALSTWTMSTAMVVSITSLMTAHEVPLLTATLGVVVLQ